MTPTPNDRQLLFVALLPPVDVQAQVTALKQDICDRVHSCHALKSPPHITLFPPFQWPQPDINRLQVLREFAQFRAPIPITLAGFGAFAPRVIYVKPLPTPALLAVHADLQDVLNTTLQLVDPVHNRRAFTPHMTIAHRDLTPPKFKQAWHIVQAHALNLTFTATHLTLLQHNGHHWQIEQEWPFAQPAASTAKT